jgi:hypothetical protein
MAIQTISNSRAFGWVNACSNDGLALQGILLRASFNSVEGCVPERPAGGASTAQQTPVRVANPQQVQLRRTQGDSLLVEINGLRQLQLLNGVFVKQLTTALVVILASAGPLFTKLCIQGDEKALRPPHSVLPPILLVDVPIGQLSPKALSGPIPSFPLTLLPLNFKTIGCFGGYLSPRI